MGYFDFRLVLMGFILTIGIFAAHYLVNLNIRIYRGMGFQRFASFWQRQLHWWIPTVRSFYALGAILLFLKGFGVF